VHGVGGLDGESGAEHVVAGLAIGVGNGRCDGGLAGAGAADDESEVVAGGGGKDGGALLVGGLRHAVEGAPDVAGIEPELLTGGELAGGGEEARLAVQVVGGSVVGHAARAPADAHGVAAVERQPGQFRAVRFVEGGALNVGLGEGGAGRGHALDQREGARSLGVAPARGAISRAPVARVTTWPACSPTRSASDGTPVRIISGDCAGVFVRGRLVCTPAPSPGKAGVAAARLHPTAVLGEDLYQVRARGQTPSAQEADDARRCYLSLV
jgi:hypothetical protein